ncbi:MAG: response regulator [Fibromonadaceae bacterium]|jgi:CheY-like chemotaxis protein|nr:response regulator [Fibromonadaceae bacterium]
MAALEKISTLNDMKELMNELHRLEIKLLFDFFGVLQDFSSKKFFPQWLQKKGINTVFVTDKGNEIFTKLNNSKKLCVIVYDLETPDLNGLQFLAALESKPDLKSRCKIIMAIPKLAPDAQAAIMQKGANTIILKPVGDEIAKAFEKIGLA